MLFFTKIMKNINTLIGISGKAGVGKDSIGIIIQGLNMSLDLDMIIHQVKLGIPFKSSCGFEIKKFANKIKQFISLLIGCNINDLEDRKFKEKQLGGKWTKNNGEILTPRLLMQLIGTDCFRNIIHENTWVNALFTDYIAKDSYYNNWVVTDVRFPNEMKAIKDLGGAIIRVNKPLDCDDCEMSNLTSDVCFECVYYPEYLELNNHLSETALDNYKFDYIIDNNNSIEDLINEVKKVLIDLNIL